jgi:hypothetical protein
MPQSNFKKSEIIIAIIGLIGIVTTGTLSNWDKLVGNKIIVEEYTGYNMTDDFETEMRYYFEISGTRKTLEAYQNKIFDDLKMDLLEDSPDDAKENRAIIEINKELAKELFDKSIRKIIPVYKKYFTISEIQNMNKFYSTKTMQIMLNKMPLLINESTPIQQKLLSEYYEELEEEIDKILDEIE